METDCNGVIYTVVAILIWLAPIIAYGAIFGAICFKKCRDKHLENSSQA